MPPATGGVMFRPLVRRNGGVVMVVADALNIISRSGGAFASRWAHVVVGITWIGLLYYFNFVQVPSFAEMEAAARNNAIDKLASRALWWFRWAAVATVVTGILILLFQAATASNGRSSSTATTGRAPRGMSIATGIAARARRCSPTCGS